MRLLFLGLIALIASAMTYEIGPGHPYSTIAAAPWASLQPGDTVHIYPKSPVQLTTSATSNAGLLTFAGPTAAIAVGSSVYLAGGPATLGSVIAVSGNTVTVDPLLIVGGGLW